MATATRSASASPSILPFNTNVDASCFPLKSITEVVNFFQRSLEGGEPDLTLLSIIAGFIELSLTTGDAAQAAAAAVSASEHVTAISSPTSLAGVGMCAQVMHNEIIKCDTVPFPVVTLDFVAGLYRKFQGILADVEKPKSPHNRQATRMVIKKVSDVIWNSLIRSSYKDRAHLQNLYSYLSGNKLDCFGVALAVVAGCQMLGYRDVRLAISEDHAWVVFGGKRAETIEITWHGKGSEDKRGQDITPGIESGAWLYLRGLAVVCDRAMEVAAVVSAINISLTATTDCVEVGELQQRLLWLLYDMGHLKKYPMALGALGELEEICPTANRASCEQLYYEAIQAARAHYSNHHVYPYTYQGNYYNRLCKYRDAFAAWANAADVIRLYTYSCRDDEEVYKELLDIANETIPCIMKTESSGHSARSILRYPEVFANLLRFYDGICQWEEDSLTPILHIGWAKPLVNNITKFDYDVRSQLIIKVPEDAVYLTQTSTTNTIKEAVATTVAATIEKHENNEAKEELNNLQIEGNNNFLKKDEKSPPLDAKKTEIPTTLADLTAACGEKILNPEFLLQGGDKPFAENSQQKKNHEANGTSNNNKHVQQEKKNNEHIIEQLEVEQQQQQQQQQANANNKHATATLANNVINDLQNNADAQSQAPPTPSPTPTPRYTDASKDEEPFEYMLKRPIITLYSQKMKGLKNLLLAEKLNTHAISLQVTAQSVASKKVRGSEKQQTTQHHYVAVSSVNAAAAAHQTHEVAAGAAQQTAHADSIAASRPKRTRRE